MARLHTKTPRHSYRRTSGSPSRVPATSATHIDRSPLTEEELQQLKEKMRTQFGWESDPRPFQLLGAQAQLEGIDTIIQAPTGSGKTAVVAGPHLSARTIGKCTIMVVPLLALQSEMVCAMLPL